MLIQPHRSHLLVIDVQERLLPTIHDGESVSVRCIGLVEGARLCGVPTTVTEQYPQGLGETTGALLEALGNAPRFAKTDFSAPADPEIRADLDARHAEGHDQIVVAGLEAHVCVLQSVLDLLSAGFAVFVVCDAIGAYDDEDRRVAVKRMADAGAVLVSAEMVLFEWIGSSRSPAFKSVSSIVKSMRRP